MRAIGFGILFAIFGLIGSYLVFGTVRGRYINPEAMIGSIIGHTTASRYAFSRVVGVEERAIKILISTTFAGVLGLIIGGATAGRKGSGYKNTLAGAQRKATRPMNASDCSYCTFERRSGRRVCGECGKQLVESAPPSEADKQITELTKQVSELTKIVTEKEKENIAEIPKPDGPEPE